VAKAAPDGYTLLMAIDSTLVMNQSLYAKLPYDPLKDFAPITRTFSTRPILIVDAASGPKTVQELIRLAKANPGKLTFGAGTITTRLGGELFKNLAGIEMMYVPYKGSAGVVQGLLSGGLNMIVDGVAANLPHIKSGKFRVLAGLSLLPVPALPDVPTLASAADLPGFDVVIWMGLLAPAGTPAAIVNRTQQEVARVLGLPEVNEKLTALGVYAATSTPEEFAAFIRSEAGRWSKVIRQAGIRVD
jgi:tripartite-type tricarboxylate transporter receptor subunit TctC